MTHIVTLQLTLTQPKVILTREIVWTIPLSFEGNKEGGGGTLNESSAWLTSIQPSSNQQEGRDEERNSAHFPQS